MEFLRRTCIAIAATCVFMWCTTHVAAQVGELTDRNTFFAFPLIFHTPEAGWGFGATAFYNFHPSKNDKVSPASQVSFGAAYTTKRQYMFYLPYEFYWSERKNHLSGELGFYYYTFHFYGVGRQMEEGIDESFAVHMPQFRATYLRKLAPHFFAGARWWFEKYDIAKSEAGGLLESGQIPGSEGSTTSGPGVVALFDSRDHVYSAHKGWYLELVYHNQSQIWGSNYWYDRYRFDLRKYFEIKKSVIALNLFGDALSGSVPFNQMAGIGGSKRMRGYYEGRYRDKNLALFQAEYRFPVWKILGGTVFGSAAGLSDRIESLSLSHAKFAAGCGLRLLLNPINRLSLRMDMAFGKNSDAFYFTVNEAF
ncbi:MAG: BamA/TamA family outer membrane protein [Flavobacteriales bacterium]|nr:BamA/TamA family outer membrane protein [Flavobacteriales bacterium]